MLLRPMVCSLHTTGGPLAVCLAWPFSWVNARRSALVMHGGIPSHSSANSPNRALVQWIPQSVRETKLDNAHAAPPAPKRTARRCAHAYCWGRLHTGPQVSPRRTEQLSVALLPTGSPCWTNRHCGGQPPAALRAGSLAALRCNGAIDTLNGSAKRSRSDGPRSETRHENGPFRTWSSHGSRFQTGGRL